IRCLRFDRPSGIVSSRFPGALSRVAAKMKIGIAKERRAHEMRVAVSPDTVKKLIGLGADVAIETGAGLGAAYTDQAFADAGATIVPDERSAIGDADIVLKVQRPLTGADGGVDEMALLKPGS